MNYDTYSRRCFNPFDEDSVNILLIKLEENKKTQKKTLILKNMHLDEIPDLRSYVWIHTLLLSHNYIKCINRYHIPPNVEILGLDNNLIETVDVMKIPKSVKQLYIRNNKIHSFDGRGMKIQKLYISGNYSLKGIVVFPDECEYIDISNNYIERLPRFPHNLKYINCSENNIIKVDDDIFNDYLEEIDISGNKIKEFPTFPLSVKKVNIQNNYINNLNCISKNIRELDLSYNSIKNSATFDKILKEASKLKDLKLSGNYLENIPMLPNNIEILDIDSNIINYVDPSVIPDSLQILDIRGNNIENIPEELTTRNLTVQFTKEEDIDTYSIWEDLLKEEPDNNSFDFYDNHNNTYNNYNNHNNYHNHGYNIRNIVTQVELRKRATRENPYYIIHEGDITV